MAALYSSYEPLPRYQHAAIAVGSKLKVWGGCAGPDGEEKSKKLAINVEEFDLSAEVWEQKPTQGIPPPGTQNTAYTVVGKFLYSFGGYDGSSYYNGLHQLDLHTLQWKEIEATNPSSGPQKKSGSRMVSYGESQLLIFAGYTARGQTDEVHIFDLDKKEWSSPAVTGTKPPPLAHFSFSKIDSRRAVVYGGWDGWKALGDAYVFELDKLHWSKLDTTGSSSPCARVNHAACCIASPLTGQHYPLLLMGGGGGKELFKDLWVLDVDRAVWSEIALPQDLQLRDSLTATVFGSASNFRVVVLFGGRENGRDPIAATTILHLGWRGEKWEVIKVVGKGKLGRRFSVEKRRKQMEKLRLCPTKISFSDLEFTEIVGSGGFGEVWKGRWKSKNKIVAIKKFKPGEIEREVEILSSLDHPHIIKFYGIATGQPGYVGDCIVTEYAENGSVFDYLHKKNQQPTLQQSIVWGKQVAEGMLYFHMRNIIHRDLKSSNVVLTSSLTAKICDLGSARILEHTQYQTTAVGTYAWMAPEMLRRDLVSKACDVYSFGILLWEILTKQIPFSDVVPTFMVGPKVLAGERPLIPETCDSHLAMLMKQCWLDNPKARPSFETVLEILDSKS